jgi:RimJ/RimL family protein N-acetyltransferase
MRWRTVRLGLSSMVPDEAGFFHRSWNDPEVGRYLWDGRPVAMEEVIGVIERSDREFRDRGFGLWTLRPGASDEPIGFCGLRSGELSPAELLFALDPPWRGRGLCTEAARAVLDFAFRDLGLRRVEGFANPANAPSWRVLERVGMVRFGERRTAIETLWGYALENTSLESPLLPGDNPSSF